MFSHVCLEMSLKPYKKTDDVFIRKVSEDLFSQWLPLLKHVEHVAVLLWTADGSEILEYRGDTEAELEWAKYIGGANPRLGWDKEQDPEGLSLHTKSYLYMEHPPEMRYGDLKRIVAALKAAGRKILGKEIQVGETFDPGPEFAKSDFKYNRHPEICGGVSMGVNSMVCCYSRLNADSCSYAGFPNGIPEQLPFGTFLGRQAKIFCADMGFDYLWFSNGFGFGSETWGTTGAIFDGTDFDESQLEQTKRNILEFWTYFRAECPDLPVQTRGTNLSTAIDLATDGVPLKSIYEGDYGIVPPPNSPWAALDGDFGLELMGYMSRIAKLPGEEYLFRYYIHDPWWVNSPWYDRYEGQPHDIYMPLAVARIDEKGSMVAPNRLSFLSVDNSYGDMPECCVNEPLPHLLRAEKEKPDAPSPLVWVYPFDEYHERALHQDILDMYFEDWFIRGAINQGCPINTVVSTDIFLRLDDKAKRFGASVLLTPVPDSGSEMEAQMLAYIEAGGKVLFYGNAARAGKALREKLGVEIAGGISGEIKITAPKADQIAQGAYSDSLNHREITCGGKINTVKIPGSKVRVLASAERYVLGTAGENVAWVRGTCSSRYQKGKQILQPDKASDFYPGEVLLRCALGHLGYQIRFSMTEADDKTPIFTVHRHDNGVFFSTFSKDCTAEMQMKFPLGAPLLMGYETVLKDGFSTFRFPRAEHRECRVFVEQACGKVSCKEIPPVSYQMRRRIEVEGLKNAVVRFFPERYCGKKIQVLRNASYPYFVGDPLEGEWKEEGGHPYYEMKNVTGTLTLSMTSKH